MTIPEWGIFPPYSFNYRSKEYSLTLISLSIGEMAQKHQSPSPHSSAIFKKANLGRHNAL